ncbi:YbaB/EbfC family nucleoid-associated protein [Microbispora hainanensis]|uniref:YbaB/EbfC family nucleoid-associated protein n=1 Tax=Microbispora hainanensis TaxID=568844 RepID=A0A544YLR4_9ACTN|nr:YbaB/EbfC family nucleoid-associated protein [Microbispora hainanensis]TQS17709.1 YbaB/EbfC family nucleoid-associated protein [Microbispora hainanensis]
MNPADIREEDLARAEEQAERVHAWAERARGDLEEITGTGEAASGQVTATVSAEGTVLDVTFGPRAMRLDSRTLAEEVRAAVSRARLDAARRTRELIRDGLPGFDPDEAAAQFERLLDVPWD